MEVFLGRIGLGGVLAGAEPGCHHPTSSPLGNSSQGSPGCAALHRFQPKITKISLICTANTVSGLAGCLGQPSAGSVPVSVAVWALAVLVPCQRAGLGMGLCIVPLFPEVVRRGRHFRHRSSPRRQASAQHRREQSPGGARFWGDGQKKPPSAACAWEVVRCVLLKCLDRLRLLSWAPVPSARGMGRTGSSIPVPLGPGSFCGCSDGPSSSWPGFNGESLSLQ